MCVGGGGGGTITKPDYNAYNKQFELQKDAIDNAISGGQQALQSSLTTALQGKQDIQKQLLEQKKITAENTQAEAMRLSQLIGPPPREKHAEAPTIGDQARGLRARGLKGKSGLRIGKQKTASKAGAGLNINIT